MSKTMKRIAIALVFTLVAPILLSFVPYLDSLTLKEVSAAEAKLYQNELTVGVNSTPEYIYIEDTDYNATYSYKTADKSIATVSEYGIVKGVKKGTTSISVSRTVDGVTTDMGTVEVNVKGAAFIDSKQSVGLNTSDFLAINYLNKSAKYTFKSANTKIAKIADDGLITGVKLGKTTISVTETYKGKKKKIGSITINVVNSKLALKEMDAPVSDYYTSYIDIAYRNYDATYKFTSANKKIAIVDSYGYIQGIKQGTTTISVTETYKKKTRKLGSITVNVVGSSIYPESEAVEIGINSSEVLTYVVLIKDQIYSATYSCVSADEGIVTTEFKTDDYGYEYCYIKGVALGTTSLTIYEDYNGEKREVGKVSVTVKEFPVKSFELYTDYLDTDSTGYSKTYYLSYDYSWDNMKNYITIDPYNSTTPIKFTSSDEKIIKIDSNGVVTPIKEGTATLTASCGDYTVKITAIVKFDEEQY